MSIHMIQSRLRFYDPKTVQDIEQILKEITQEIILAALSHQGFFKKAAFQGGTCLRIVHGLNRFSEDLDFCLQAPDHTFKLALFAEAIKRYLNIYGYNFEIRDKSKSDSMIQTLFLKDSSLGLMLNFKHGAIATPHHPIKIKLEIDINPPEGSGYAMEFVDFPSPFAVLCQDPSSLFSGKSHALLTRKYVKGRDWYDFLWYVGQKIIPNYGLLASALKQSGFLSPNEATVDASWYRDAFKVKISEIDWDVAKQDISRLIKPHEQATLALWSKDFFLAQLERLPL